MKILKAGLLVLLLATAARLATESGGAVVHLDECRDECTAQYNTCETDANSQYDSCAETADVAESNCETRADQDYDDCVAHFGPVTPCEDARDYARSQCWDNYGVALDICLSAQASADGLCASREQDCESHCP